MHSSTPPLDTLKDIKRMMERSSRFISLSGWSGISAGICALGGAWVAHTRIADRLGRNDAAIDYPNEVPTLSLASVQLVQDLIIIAVVTFIAAFISAFIFTFARSRRQGVPIWDKTVRRLAWNTLLPMGVGGLLILRCMHWGYWQLVAPGCLIFYGLALVNASKYTLGEIRYLGYGQLVLGLLNLWYVGAGIYFWAAGFGVLHIIYGGLMWWKYERGPR